MIQPNDSGSDPRSNWTTGSYFDHFAYGSNMSSERLMARCPSAVALTSGWVIGHQLRFHKIGTDGTAKADAFWTGNPEDRLFGVIYRCLRVDRSILDSCESLGVGYNEVPVDVFFDRNEPPVATFLYQALPTQIQTGLATAEWYANHVLRGAAEHCLPHEYQRRIADLVARSIF